jgi:hypothetical protein
VSTSWRKSCEIKIEGSECGDPGQSGPDGKSESRIAEAVIYSVDIDDNASRWTYLSRACIIATHPVIGVEEDIQARCES